MRPTLATLGLLDVVIGVALLVTSETVVGTVAGVVLLVTGVIVVAVAVLRGPPSADDGLKQAAAEAQREATSNEAAKGRVEEGGPPTGQ